MAVHTQSLYQRRVELLVEELVARLVEVEGLLEVVLIGVGVGALSEVVEIVDSGGATVGTEVVLRTAVVTTPVTRPLLSHWTRKALSVVVSRDNMRSFSEYSPESLRPTSSSKLYRSPLCSIDHCLSSPAGKIH